METSLCNYSEKLICCAPKFWNSLLENMESVNVLTCIWATSHILAWGLVRKTSSKFTHYLDCWFLSTSRKSCWSTKIKDIETCNVCSLESTIRISALSLHLLRRRDLLLSPIYNFSVLLPGTFFEESFMKSSTRRGIHTSERNATKSSR